MVDDEAFIHKIDYVTFFSSNPEGHPNRITSSKVMAILLNWCILPVCGVALGRVCSQPAKQGFFLN